MASKPTEMIITTSGSFFYYYPKLAYYVKQDGSFEIDWDKLRAAKVKKGTKLSKELITFQDAVNKLYLKHRVPPEEDLIVDIYRFVEACVDISAKHSNLPKLVKNLTMIKAKEFGLSITRLEENH